MVSPLPDDLRRQAEERMRLPGAQVWVAVHNPTGPVSGDYIMDPATLWYVMPRDNPAANAGYSTLGGQEPFWRIDNPIAWAAVLGPVALVGGGIWLARR